MTPSIVSWVASSHAAHFARPKSSTLTKSCWSASLHSITFDGFRSRCTRLCWCASSSDAQICAQDRPHARRRLRTERRDQRLQADPVQQLHHVVELPVAGDAEVVEIDRVRRLQAGDDIGFAAEALP